MTSSVHNFDDHALTSLKIIWCGTFVVQSSLDKHCLQALLVRLQHVALHYYNNSEACSDMTDCRIQGYSFKTGNSFPGLQCHCS